MVLPTAGGVCSVCSVAIIMLDAYYTCFTCFTADVDGCSPLVNCHRLISMHILCTILLHVDRLLEFYRGGEWDKWRGEKKTPHWNQDKPGCKL